MCCQSSSLETLRPRKRGCVWDQTHVFELRSSRCSVQDQAYLKLDSSNRGLDVINPLRLEGGLVPGTGLEPAHPCGRMTLNHVRLPIPPSRLRATRIVASSGLFVKGHGLVAIQSRRIRLPLYARPGWPEAPSVRTKPDPTHKAPNTNSARERR